MSLFQKIQDDVKVAMKAREKEKVSVLRMILSELKYELIVDNLEVPWAFVFLPDNSILITERKGELIHFKDGNKTTVKNLPEIILFLIPAITKAVPTFPVM